MATKVLSYPAYLREACRSCNLENSDFLANLVSQRVKFTNFCQVVKDTTVVSHQILFDYVPFMSI